MTKIRVFIVDDAAVIRRVLSAEFSSDPELEVVGAAADGRIALDKLCRLTPDIVILDVEMPVLDGLATLVEIRKTHPKLPVIMFSALTERGAEATLEALSRGATDYFTKPSGGGLDASIKVIREELIPEIKALCRRPIVTEPSKFIPQQPPVGAPLAPPDVVVIASSTGGPNALAEIFNGLPAELPTPILIVQHMPPMFTRLLAERMSANHRLKTVEAADNLALEPSKAYVAPGNYHMALRRDGVHVRIRLNQDAPENSCRPAADVLFRSAAATFGASVLGIVLTGMGQDGLRGCETIKAAGGEVLVQDQASSVVWGMPGSVAKAGLADRIMPLALFAPEILRRVRRVAAR